MLRNKYQYYMDMAYQAAKRSTCLKRQAGAIIVKNDVIISTGYNGSVKGEDHCTDVGCIRKDNLFGDDKTFCRSTHAEQNAIANAAKNGVSLKGTTMYSTAFPCITCSKLIISAGITEVNYSEPQKGRENSLQVHIYSQPLLTKKIEVIHMEKEV